ncbi:hypothetical protein EYF80_012965 [Liparis tanakae]|uniref:Uncharacterized protein n=1 Tax=Liparis tanakae TaxID=230148 RepID=A0A4Z2IHW0_9TELE|nr:hypothetical protein EYF80_012965 [Liparis tanakae]
MPSLIWQPHLLNGLSSRHLLPGFDILKAKEGFLGNFQLRGHVGSYYAKADGLLDAMSMAICGINNPPCASLSLQQSLSSNGIHQTTIQSFADGNFLNRFCVKYGTYRFLGTSCFNMRGQSDRSAGYTTMRVRSLNLAASSASCRCSFKISYSLLVTLFSASVLDKLTISSSFSLFLSTDSYSSCCVRSDSRFTCSLYLDSIMSHLWKGPPTWLFQWLALASSASMEDRTFFF